jgi:hypothetical protein
MSASAGPAADPPPVPVRMLSDALVALGAYAEPPTPEELAAAEEREGTAALTARLANALYGVALAHVATAEVAAAQAGAVTDRGEAWRATGGDLEGTVALLHYAAMRLSKDLQVVADRVPVDLGVLGAAAGAAQALTLLLEVTTIRSMDDPRAGRVTTNLARAGDELQVAAERLAGLFAVGRSVAALIEGPRR